MELVSLFYNCSKYCRTPVAILNCYAYTFIHLIMTLGNSMKIIALYYTKYQR